MRSGTSERDEVRTQNDRTMVTGATAVSRRIAVSLPVVSAWFDELRALSEFACQKKLTEASGMRSMPTPCMGRGSDLGHIPVTANSAHSNAERAAFQKPGKHPRPYVQTRLRFHRAYAKSG